MFSSIVKVITGWVRLRGATDDTFIGNTSDSLKTNVTNASGASAVNIQDGGNSITVDQATAANLNATVRNQDGSGNNITSFLTDGNRGFHVEQLENETFVAYADSVALANNKSMLSLVNTSGSSVVVRIREIRIINVQTTAVTGVVADFRLLRCVNHSAGTSITPSTHDTADILNVSVTARTGATITSEGTAILRRWQWSSDEWGVGTLDVEGSDHGMQLTGSPLYSAEPKTKPITLRANEGITIKNVTNSTAGTFDLVIVFTQE